MIKSLLIANRGEIACRIIRTARALGLRTVAVYSEADAGALHVRLADEAVAIGPAPARESYLVIDRLIAAARATGAEAIHPGYGFLSERAEFAEACAAAGIIFVGPPPSAIRAMGLKDGAKALMQAAGVPVVPGYHGDNQDTAFLRQKAYEIGYPVLIKAVAGGGGKGMRRVDRQIDFDAALASAQREAASSFGDPRVLIEKYVTSPRHVEIQVFADSHGNVVHLFERDCTAQRRHQKVIEEAPAPGMPQAVRAVMGAAACAAAKAVGYVGAGTVEFIADGSAGLSEGGFWFMEMNTRLQVEHPVTEAITGLDLVEWQLRVANGERLPLTQADLAIHGHAVEARLYAEDPEKGFLPSTGRLHALSFPTLAGVRVDTGVTEGDQVSPYYDPMIAKLIAHGPDRDTALDRLAQALRQTVVAGPKANAAFLVALANHADFRAFRFDTGFIERHLDDLGAVPRAVEPATIAAAALALREIEKTRLDAVADARGGGATSPWAGLPGFLQFSGPRTSRFDVAIDGDQVKVEIVETAGQGPGVRIEGVAVATPRGARIVAADGGVFVLAHGRQTFVTAFDPLSIDPDAEAAAHGAVVKAPMHGKIIALDVAPGAAVARGERLFVVEAMKMEHAVLAPRDGTIAEVLAGIGEQVAESAGVVVFADA